MSLPRSPFVGSRRGQALVEFAIVSFVLTFLIGAMLAVGLLLFGANVVQQAADVGAQELARLPLPPATEFMDWDYGSIPTPDEILQPALATPKVRKEIFDEQFLVVDVSRNYDLTLTGTDDLDAPGRRLTIDQYFNGATLPDGEVVPPKPLINRLLRPLMVIEHVTLTSLTGTMSTTSIAREHSFLRYPGALVRTTERHPDTEEHELTVLVPVISQTSIVSGTTAVYDRITWRHVVEEIDDDDDPRNSGAFNIARVASSNAPSGIAGLRIHYPYQSTALVGFRYADAAGNAVDPVSALGQPVVNLPIVADDASVRFDPLPLGYCLLDGEDCLGRIDVKGGAYVGTFGLGRVYALSQAVRPFRKLVSAQGIYRREVFE